MQTVFDTGHLEACAVNTFLAQLSSYQGPIPPATLEKIIASSSLTSQDLINWIHFDPQVYARNRVALLPNVEVLVMCWNSGQMTPIHDHKGSACAVQVLQGIATEVSYRKSKCGSLVPCSSARYCSGDIASAYDQDVHQMGNLEASDSKLVTLHCYSPPLTGMELFKEEATYFSGYSQLVEQVSQRITQKSRRSAPALHTA